MNPHGLPFLLPLLFASLLPLPLRGQCGLGLQWQAGDPLGHVRGNVTALVNWDPDGAGPAPLQLVIGGAFDVGHGAGAQLATWDGSQWTTRTVPALATGITAMMVWNGQLVVAFDRAIYGYDGTTWTAFGSVSGIIFPPSPPPRINALVDYNGSLIAVGRFNSVAGMAASNVARFDGTSWSALGSGVPGEARCAATFNGSLQVGGSLFAGPAAAAQLQAWNGSVWSPVGLWNGSVDTLAVRIGTSVTNSFLFAGGSFTVINGTLSAPLVASFSPSTNSWSAIGSPGSGSVPTRCTNLFVRSTGISTYEVTAALEISNLQKVWRRAGTSWTPLGSVPSKVTSLSYYGGSYFLGQDGGQFAGWPFGIIPPFPFWGAHSGLRRYDSPTNEWSHTLGSGLDGSVYAVCVDGTEAIIGGAFTAISGVPMNGIARGHAGAWQPLGGGLTGGSGVFVVAKMPNGDVVAAGDFTFAGGQPANRIARWNGTQWAPLAAGTNGTVHALLPQSNGDLIVAGNFTSGGGAENYIARWNGTAFVPLGTGINNTVYALAQMQDGAIVAAGHFTSAGGVAANRIARWNGATWSSFGIGLDGTAYTLAVAQNGDLWVGGAFQNAGGGLARFVARWHGGAWSSAGSVAGPDMLISKLTLLPNGDLIAGGLDPAGTGARLARLRGAFWTSLAVTGSSVRAMAMWPDGKLAVGGDFLLTGSVASAYVVTLAPTCPATAVAYGSGCAGAFGLDVLSALTLPWNNTTLRARATGLPWQSLALTIYGFAPISVPIATLLPQGLPGCNLLVTPDILGLAVPTAGVLDTEVFLTIAPAVIGVTFYHQVVPLELNGALQVSGITATNGLALTVGWL